MAGLTIENNFFILKMEKSNKIIFFLPRKCLAFEIKENTENTAEYRRKKTCFKSFFILLIFFLSEKVGAGA